MKKLLTTSALMLATTFATSSQAGWLDGVLGGQEAEKTTASATPATIPSAPQGLTTAVQSGVSDSLVDMVTSQLGVSDTQATGGLGAIFKTAQSSLSAGEFSQIAAAVPGMDSLLSAAPSGESSGGLGGLLAQAGSAGELMSAFDSLGLNSDQLASFTKIITDYFDSSEESGLSDLLMKGLGSFM